LKLLKRFQSIVKRCMMPSRSPTSVKGSKKPQIGPVQTKKEKERSFVVTVSTKKSIEATRKDLEMVLNLFYSKVEAQYRGY
jgi:hypothetical protein